MKLRVFLQCKVCDRRQSIDYNGSRPGCTVQEAFSVG